MEAAPRSLLLPCLVLALAGLSEAGAGLSLLSRASRARAAPSAPASGVAVRTLAALDADGDGHVSPGEVAAFAVSQGLDAASASQEFAELDANGDGTLDSSEVASALGSPSAAAAVAPPVAEKIAQPARTVEAVPSARTQPFLAATRAAPASATAGVGAAPVAVEAPSGVVAQPHLDTQPGASFAATAGTAENAADRRSNAGVAASSVVEQLAQEEEEEGRAEALDHQAAELRSNATQLVRLTLQRAEKAGVAAAHEKAEALLHQLTDLEEKAKHDEVQAAALRTKSRADVLQADELVAVANSALKP